MIYILKNIGKGFIGSGERQISPTDLVLLEDSTPAIIRMKTQTLAQASWVLNQATGYYEYTFTSTRITANSDVEFIPHTASEQVVTDASIQPHTPVSVGQVVISATNAPAGDIIVDVLIKNIKDV
jgi:hypothetical protein